MDIFDRLTNGGDIFDRLAFQRGQDEIRAELRANPNTLPGEAIEEPKSFLGGLRDAVLPSREALNEVASMIGMRGPVEATRAVGGAIKGVAGAQWDQAVKAKDALMEGDFIGAQARALAATLPIIGPAAANAGDAIAGGDIGYGLGQATGLVGTALMPSGVKARNTAKAAQAPAIKAAAEAEYAGLFGKNARSQNIAERIAPEMMERRLKFDNPKTLAETAENQATVANRAVDDAIASMQNPIELDAVLARTGAEKASHLRPGAFGPDSEAIIEKIGKFERDVLPRNASSAEVVPGASVAVIEPQAARELRRLFDEKPGQRGAYAGAENLAPDVKARGAVADALRKELNADDAVAAANAEESFWLNVKTISEHAPEGKGIGAIFAENAKLAGTGALAHAVGGGLNLPFMGPVASAPVMYAVYRTIRDIPKTPAWRSASAIRKREFAKALQSKDYGKAAQLGAEIMAGGIIADEAQ